MRVVLHVANRKIVFRDASGHITIDNGEFEEGKHPRATNGEFGSGGGVKKSREHKDLTGSKNIKKKFDDLSYKSRSGSWPKDTTLAVKSYVAESDITSGTKPAYGDINTALRTGDLSNPVIAKAVKDVDIACQGTMPEDLILHRVVTAGAGVDIIKGLKVGDTYSDPAFTSTSLDKNSSEMASGFAESRIEIKASKGSKAGFVPLLMGDPDTPEYEVLLPRNAKMTVTSIENSVVKMEYQ